MKTLHPNFSPLAFEAQEPLTVSEAVKTYLAILFGVGMCMLAFFHLIPTL